MPHVIEATIMTSCAKGEAVLIPRIPIIPSDMSFEFKRLQCSVRLKVGTGKNLYVFAADTKTKNIVYQRAVK